jgi:hypothetical protein
LEPGISLNQTDEMQAAGLQLVVPESIQASYRAEQRAWLLTLNAFLALVKERATPLTAS